MFYEATAPANIALIKYMGKKDEHLNKADNASISYTLAHLKSRVRLEADPLLRQDVWSALVANALYPLPLSELGQARFLKHLIRMKERFAYTGFFRVQSANSFPHAAGLASSASSFAALTLAANEALSQLTGLPPLSNSELADLSRQASGSSCRSFYAPWALWDETGVHGYALPYTQLTHQVFLISSEEKAVSSSEAHRRVLTSPYYEGRGFRVAERLEHLLRALKQQQWATAYQLCFDEFQDMHQLFETAKDPFSYRVDATFKILDYLQAFWKQEGDGPLVTMDAGPNIHVLYRLDQNALQKRIQDKIEQEGWAYVA